MKFFKKLKPNNKKNLEYNLYINNINGILQALTLNLVIPFASIYTKRLHGTDTHIAFINSMPAVFCIIAVLVGTYLFRRFKDKQKITAICFISARFFFLTFIIVPFLPPTLQPTIFVMLYSMMNFPNSIATIGWQSYIADLFSPNWRGKAFSRRSSLANISALIVTLITGNLLYFIPHNENQRIQLYQVFFGIAFLFALLEVYSFMKHKLDSGNSQVETVTDLNKGTFLNKTKDVWTMIIGNKVFFSYIIVVMIFHFAWQMGWPLFFSYEYDVLHSNESWTAITSTISFFSQAIAFILWQKLADKKGNSFALSVATFIMALCPFFYMIATNMYMVAAFCVITASAAAGVTLLLLNNLYDSSPNKNRTMYIACYTIVTNITLMIAPILGMKLKGLFDIKSALFIDGLLRTGAAILVYIRYRMLKNTSYIKSDQTINA